ncbi:unnamed protein product [Fraxinus pennsylvanica]|uniref:Pentatricopeptide repeat-containing protein n=1 Tax=Fraxinus pennsylvanica TaxID=56036 RepID=A0AAD2EGX2_9LAMI|nr:unnamed protein product [Fraxinus pennsylvanica]
MEKLKKVSSFRLSSLLRLQKDPKLALQLFLNPNPNDPNPKPFRYSLLSYDLIISKLGRARMLSEMENIVEKLKSDTRIITKEIILCNIITFYGRARLPHKALKVFEEMPAFRCQRTMKSVNTVLNSLLICRQFEKMWELFMEIEKYGSPDACTYNILINARRVKGDVEGALNMFDEMIKRGVEPNVVTFGTVISGYCAKLELNKAFRLKKKMEGDFKIKPNAHIYTALIKGLCKVDELDKAIKLKEEMSRKKVELDPAIYSTLINQFFKAGRKAEVSELLEEMGKVGCKLDTVTYNALICGFCQEKEFDSAFGVLNDMEKNGCKPDVISYNVIISGLCREGKTREAHDLLEDMPRRKCLPDVVTYRILFDGLCDQMHLKEGAGILDEMLFKGYVPRSSSVSKFVGELVRGHKTEILWTVLNSLAKRNAIDSDIWRFVISLVCKEATTVMQLRSLVT